MNVGELKELLDNYGDHMDVVFLRDTGDTMVVFRDVEIDDGMFDGDPVVKIDVGAGRKVE